MPVNSCRTPGHSGSHAFPLSVVGNPKKFQVGLAETLTKKHLDPGQGEHILYKLYEGFGCTIEEISEFCSSTIEAVTSFTYLSFSGLVESLHELNCIIFF